MTERMRPWEIYANPEIPQSIKTIERFAVDVWCECDTAADSYYRPFSERAQAQAAAKWASKTMRSIETSAPEHEIVGNSWFCIREYEKFKAMEKTRKEAEEAQK